MDVGPRALALGGAFVGIAEGVEGALSNPAGLNLTNRKNILLMHSLIYAEMKHDFIGYVHPFWKTGQKKVWGCNLDLLTMDQVEVIKDSEITDTIHPYEGVATVSYGQSLGPLMLGMNMKLGREEINESNITSAAFDTGLLLVSFDERLSIGAVIQNLGLRKDYAVWENTLPLNIKFGGGYKLLKPLLVSLELDLPIDYHPSGHLGAEYFLGIKDGVSLASRAGYNTTRISDLGLWAGFSWGLGLHWKPIALDYAFVPYAGLGDTHRISVSFFLGGIAEEEKLIQKYYQSGREFYREKELFNARSEFRQVLTIAPRHYRAKKHLIEIQNEIDSAVDPKLLFIQGYSSYERGDYQEAVNLFKNVLKLNPDHKEAKTYLFVAEEELRKTQRAKERKKVEKEIETDYARALKFYKNSQYEQALLEFQKIVQLYPEEKRARLYVTKSKVDLVENLYQLGLRLFSEGKIEDVLKVWEKILQYDPKHREVKKLKEETEKELASLREKQAKDYYEKGLKEYLDKNLGKAKEFWEKAFQLDRENIRYRRALERITEEIKLKNPKK